MKTEPIATSPLAFTDTGIAFSQVGALQQAQHVFLAGNELPARWQRRERFVVLETGFGLGNNFLATWQAWRDDPARCERLFFISIEKHPLTAGDLRAAHERSSLPAMARELVDAWPPLVPSMQTLEFDGGRVRLLLAFGDVRDWLPEIVANVDAFYLDGFAPANNSAMWEPSLMKALARLAAPNATLATWTAASAVRDGLRAAGFEVRNVDDAGGQHDITLARFAPAFTPKRSPSRIASATSSGHALVIGAGLAGCATAHELAAQGWSVTVLDRHRQAAGGASGNPAGLFHGVVNAQDGTHARFNRAAALAMQRHLPRALADDAKLGALTGLLRLDEAPASELQGIVSSLGLPPDYVQALGADETSRLSGLALARSARFYPSGGWLRPAALCAWWLRQAGERVRFRGGVEIACLQRTGGRWQLRDAAGDLIEEAATLVLCNAADAARLLPNQSWPIDSVRGQLSMLPASQTALALPRLPIAGSGYLLPAIDGMAVFGSTSQPGDTDPSVRAADHEVNLGQLQRLVGQTLSVSVGQLSGRTAWRSIARDRMPLIGAVADLDNDTMDRPLEQPRFVPRVPGLYVFTALASRGIAWSVLGAQTVASAITGAPAPVEASLLDSVDAARFVARAATRAARKGSGPS